jgi:hypothetical protein
MEVYRIETGLYIKNAKLYWRSWDDLEFRVYEKYDIGGEGPALSIEKFNSFDEALEHIANCHAYTSTEKYAMNVYYHSRQEIANIMNEHNNNHMRNSNRILYIQDLKKPFKILFCKNHMIQYSYDRFIALHPLPKD